MSDETSPKAGGLADQAPTILSLEDMERLAVADREFSETNHTGIWVLRDEETAVPYGEVHFRGGEWTRVIGPDGDWAALLHSNDIVHFYGPQGGLTARFTVAVPPEGYRVLTEDEFKGEVSGMPYESRASGI